MRKRSFCYKGFSLLELVVTIGLMAIISVFVFPLALNQLQSKRLETTTAEFVSKLKLQQQFAFSSRNDSSYGTYVESTQYTTFDGDTYSTGQNLIARKIPIGLSINYSGLSGGNQIIFPKSSLKPSSYGYILITDGSKTYRIDITSEGEINYSLQ